MVFVPAFCEERRQGRRRGNLKGYSTEPGRKVIECCPRRRMMSLSTRRDFLAATFGAAALSRLDRKSTRLNSSHLGISYAVFCFKIKSTQLNSSHLGISYAAFCLKKKTLLTY